MVMAGAQASRLAYWMCLHQFSSLRVSNSTPGVERPPCLISSSSLIILSLVAIALSPSKVVNLESAPPPTQAPCPPSSTEPLLEIVLIVSHKRYKCVVSRPHLASVSIESPEPSTPGPPIESPKMHTSTKPSSTSWWYSSPYYCTFISVSYGTLPRYWAPSMIILHGWRRCTLLPSESVGYKAWRTSVYSSIKLTLIIWLYHPRSHSSIFLLPSHCILFIIDYNLS